MHLSARQDTSGYNVAIGIAITVATVIVVVVDVVVVGRLVWFTSGVGGGSIVAARQTTIRRLVQYFAD